MLKMTKLLLVFLFVTLISGFSLLLLGIKIDSFSFGNINISQFYIKLDKKLIVDIDYIQIGTPKTQSNSSIDDLKKNIELLPKILNLFQKIHIERLKTNNNEFTIALDDKSIYLDNKAINISSNFDFESNKIILDINSLYLKDIDLMLDGKIKIDYLNEKLSHNGNFYLNEIEGQIKFESTPKKLKFHVNSNEFTSLKFLKKFFRLDKIAEEWMYDNVTGGIKLDNFYGEIDLVNKKIIENSLTGNATIDQAKIRFHKNVLPVVTKRLDLKFEKGNLYFDLISPNFNGIKMDGSSVVINNIASQKNGEVVVAIKAKAKLDKNIHSILKAYNINIPLLQIDGVTDASLILKFPYSLSKSMTTKGLFIVDNSNIKINDTFEFFSSKSNVILEGHIVKIIDSHFKHKDMIDSIVNIDIDTKSLKSNGTALINSFIINSEKQEIVNIKNKKTKISLDFNKETNIVLHDLDTNIKIADFVYVDIKELSSIYSYSNLLKELSIKDGYLKLKIEDSSNLILEGFINNLNFPLYKNDNKVDSIFLNGEIKNENTYISSKDNDINISINKDKIFLFLENFLLDLSSANSNEKQFELPNLDIKAKDLKLKVEDAIYDLKTIDVVISNNNIDFQADAINLDIPLLKNGKKVQELKLKGFIDVENMLIETLDKKLFFKSSKSNEIDIKIEDYDLFLELNNKNKSKYKKINLYGKNSKISLDNEYDFIAKSYELKLDEKETYFHLIHNNTDITYKKDFNKQINIEANNISDVFINSIFKKNILDGGNIHLIANGDENKLNGKVNLSNVKIEDLAIINNLLIFINSSPALINPLLAVPSVVGMASNKGFNLTGYKVNKGIIEFDYNLEDNLFNISKLITEGNGIDFDGNGVIDLNKMTIDSKLKLIFFKDYSKIVDKIPVVNYVLLGDNKSVATQVDIFGDLNNPKLKTNLTKDAFSVPLNIGKRIIESPLKLFDFIKEIGK